MAWWDHEELKSFDERSDRWWDEIGQYEMPNHPKVKNIRENLKRIMAEKNEMNKPKPIYPHNSSEYREKMITQAEEELRVANAMRLKPSTKNGTKNSHYVTQEDFKVDEKTEGLKFDQGKPRMDLIPPEIMIALGEILAFGAKKYQDRNWEKGFNWGRAQGALMRHLTSWSMGEENDPESGMPHLWHAACNIAFLITFAERGIGTDDRPEIVRNGFKISPGVEISEKD